MVRCTSVAAMAALGLAMLACQNGSHISAEAMEDAAARRSPVIGEPAPDFTLVDQNEIPVTLSDQRGKWVVLYFYPADDTPACTCQATEFTGLLSNFRDMNAEVYGISADGPAKHRQFAQRYGLELRLLSDPDRDVMREYGAWVDSALGEKNYGRVIRTTMIVGPDGVIRYHWPEVIPRGHAERVRQKLAELQQKRT